MNKYFFIIIMYCFFTGCRKNTKEDFSCPQRNRIVLHASFSLENVNVVKFKKYIKDKNFSDSTFIDSFYFKTVRYTEPNNYSKYWQMFTYPDSIDVNYDYVIELYNNEEQHKYHISDITYSIHQFGRNFVCQLDSIKVNGKNVEDYFFLDTVGSGQN